LESAMLSRIGRSFPPRVIQQKNIIIFRSIPKENLPTVLGRSRNLVHEGLQNEKILSLALRVPLLRAIHTYWVRKQEHYVGDLTKTLDVRKIERWERTYCEVLQDAERVLLQAIFVKKDDAAAIARVLDRSQRAILCFQRGNLSELCEGMDYQLATDEAQCDTEIVTRWQRLTSGPKSRLEAIARKSLVAFGVGHLSSKGGKWDPKIYQIYLLTLAHMNRNILDGVDPDLLATGVQALTEQLEEFVASLKG